MNRGPSFSSWIPHRRRTQKAHQRLRKPPEKNGNNRTHKKIPPPKKENKNNKGLVSPFFHYNALPKKTDQKKRSTQKPASKNTACLVLFLLFCLFAERDEDPMFGLLNPDDYEKGLEEAWERAKPAGSTVTVKESRGARLRLAQTRRRAGVSSPGFSPKWFFSFPRFPFSPPPPPVVCCCSRCCCFPLSFFFFK